MARIKYRKERGRAYAGCWYYETSDGDRIYYCSFWKGGKNITAKYGAKSKGYSLKKCSLYRADLMRGKEKTRQQKRDDAEAVKVLSIDHLYHWYLNENSGKGRDDSRYNLYLLPFWKGKNLSACTNVDVGRYRKWLEERPGRNGTGLSKQTIKHCLALLKRILRLAVQKKEGFVLLITNFSMPSFDNTVTEELSDVELQRLLHVLKTDKVNKAVCDMLLLILCTGCRQGEILKLRWTDIKWDDDTILLRQTKNGRDVVIPMNKSAREILCRQKKSSMVIFPGKGGKQRYCISKQAKRLRDLAGLPSSFRPCHGLRHHYATQLATQGIDVTVVSKMLGHKSIAVTMRYVEITDKRKRQAADMMNIVGIGGGK